MTIATETQNLIEAALDGDPALTTLAVTGTSPTTLNVHISFGIPASTIGGCTYYRNPPFRRETLADLVVRMQRLRWQRATPLIPLAMPPVEADLRILHQKYGTLRFYWSGDLPEPGDAIISAAEHLSGHVCEACGAPGSQQNWSGWWNTHCPDHTQKRPS